MRKSKNPIARLSDRLGRLRRRRRWQAALSKWKAENPDASYALFYAAYTKQRLTDGFDLPRSLGRDNDPQFQRQRATAVRDLLIKLGLKPKHTVLDYGCGSLWIGEQLIAYLEPGGYTGADVTEAFYQEAVRRMPQEFLDKKRPQLRLISDLLSETARRPFDFIVSIDVLFHVPPDELDDYFQKITSMAGDQTRILIAGMSLRGTKYHGLVWNHGRAALAPSLAKQGYELAPFRYSVERERSSLSLFEIEAASKEDVNQQ